MNFSFSFACSPPSVEGGKVVISTNYTQSLNFPPPLPPSNSPPHAPPNILPPPSPLPHKTLETHGNNVNTTKNCLNWIYALIVLCVSGCSRIFLTESVLTARAFANIFCRVYFFFFKRFSRRHCKARKMIDTLSALRRGQIETSVKFLFLHFSPCIFIGQRAVWIRKL